MFSISKEEHKPENPFQLPIDYLDPADKYVLNDVVATDLELTADISNTTMYHYIMKPRTPFEENMMTKWKQTYTTNIGFLEDTQHVLKDMIKLPIPEYSPEYENLMKIWSDTKEDPNFLERYSYMEFDMFKWVNTQPSFLQAISVINMASPILSFLVPFVLFLMPFFIVKLQGHAITFSMYLQVLKEISRNHFIGKIINNIENISPVNLLYLVMIVGLYAYQIYQNYISCIRFYDNIRRMNSQICDLQTYLDSSMERMSAFASILEKRRTYSPFLSVLKDQCSQLGQLKTHILFIRPFQPSLSKISEIGSLLGCYYEIYSNKKYGEALLYSFSFQGYIENMRGICENIEAGRIGFATFVGASDISGNPLVIKNEYYPALMNETYVANDADMEKNMVITGPNAAGKTTYLKTTMVNVIFTQQLGCGFYTECCIRPYTHIHSYLNIPDTSGRDSLFQAESRRCKEIIGDVLEQPDSSRHFCIFDELYSGTNPEEATKSAYSFLLWLSKRPNVDFILTTHYVDICERFSKSNSRITNWKMDAKETEDGDIEYSYKIVQGVSKIQGAITVLRNMDYPAEIIDSIVKYDKEKIVEN